MGHSLPLPFDILSLFLIILQNRPTWSHFLTVVPFPFPSLPFPSPANRSIQPYATLFDILYVYDLRATMELGLNPLVIVQSVLNQW